MIHTVTTYSNCKLYHAIHQLLTTKDALQVYAQAYAGLLLFRADRGEATVRIVRQQSFWDDLYTVKKQLGPVLVSGPTADHRPTTYTHHISHRTD